MMKEAVAEIVHEEVEELASPDAIDAVCDIVNSEVEELASVVPIFPPRPDAIMTLIASDDLLPGAQTLLYSVKKSLPSNADYPPELVVLATPNVSKKVRSALYPTFCTRIIEVDPIMYPPGSLNKKVSKSHVDMWENSGGAGGLTKLHMFRLTVYDTVVYLDVDCLAAKDISPLLQLGKVYVESEALVAAAPSIFPPGKFNTGVLVVRPSQQVFDNMMGQRSLLSTFDGGDFGFLNAYFSDWFRDMPPQARLPFSCNAQHFMYHATYEKQPYYWDRAVAPDLMVINYSSSPKPWDLLDVESSVGNPEKDGQRKEQLDGSFVKVMKTKGKVGELELLWKKNYSRSCNYAIKIRKEKKEQENKKKLAAVAAAAEREEPPQSKDDQKNEHKLLAKRFKALRLEGKDSKEAMQIARSEYGLDKNDNINVGTQVASMFGMPTM